jgi:hypothetical protein
VNEMVRTLAGNGTKGSDYKGGGRGTSQVCLGRLEVFSLMRMEYFSDKLSTSI